MQLNSDQLAEIPDKELPQLAEVYENVTWAPHVICFIHTAMRWKKSEKYKNDLIFYALADNSWKKDGTIFVMLMLETSSLFLFTLDETCANLVTALESCTFTEIVTLCCLHEKHILQVCDVFQTKQMSITDVHVPCRMVVMAPRDASNLTFECPPEAYIKKLDATHAGKINNQWPHKYPGSDKYILSLLEMNGGYGVFLKETDQLVASIVKHCFGHLGMLHTDDSFKRRGYGSLITKVLAKEIGEEGHWPFGAVLENNQASLEMFNKLGFDDIGMATYMACSPPQ